jgi:Fur family ferric uptake transcriptional regulator
VQAPDVEAAVASMRAHGLRATAARRLVLEALYAADGPLPAERIVAALGGRSDIASVYRNLETLEHIGLVRHFHLGHGPGLYVRAADAREYLACESCGAVRAVVPGELDPARTLIRTAFGYEARFTHFPIVGRCERCSAASQAQAAAGR